MYSSSSSIFLIAREWVVALSLTRGCDSTQGQFSTLKTEDWRHTSCDMRMVYVVRMLVWWEKQRNKPPLEYTAPTRATRRLHKTYPRLGSSHFSPPIGESVEGCCMYRYVGAIRM